MFPISIPVAGYLGVAVVAFGAGTWIGHQDVYKERQHTAEVSAQCLEDQRDVAQRAADAYSAELAAATDRAVAAEAASRAAADRLRKARSEAVTKIVEVRRADPIPVACITDDLRVRINAAVAAINAGQDSTVADSGLVPVRVPTAP